MLFLLKSHAKGLEGLRRKGRAPLTSWPPRAAFTTRLHTCVFQAAAPASIPAAGAVLRPVGPRNTACPLGELRAETHGLSPETRLCCVTLCEFLSLSGPKILGQTTLQAPGESDVLLNVALEPLLTCGGERGCLTCQEEVFVHLISFPKPFRQWPLPSGFLINVYWLTDTLPPYARKKPNYASKPAKHRHTTIPFSQAYSSWQC